MIRVESAADQVNVAKVYEAKQEQVFQYWDDLGEEERRSLLAQIASIDFQEFGRLVRQGIEEAPGEAGRITELTPAEMIPLPSTTLQEQERARARAAGLELLQQGEVAVFLVAGGQGTRLGFEGPKGCFPLLPISGASLFQHFAEKILALGRRVKRRLHLFIMTSQANDEQTRAFFREHRNFGLQANEVHFHPQAMLPVIDPRQGKILLASRSELLLSPNGHGGSVRVIQDLREMLDRIGVRVLFYHQVDNPVITMADPAFIGFHILRDSQFSSKAVAKEKPGEHVGVFCRDGGHTRVVEYTELGEREREARDPDGKLSFRAGNIATHVISVDFVAPDEGADAFQMPYHLARKAVPYFRDGELVEASVPNSIRFESFIFDTLKRARNPVTLEADRAREFAPVKNAEGENSPATSRRALARMWAEWLDAAGGGGSPRRVGRPGPPDRDFTSRRRLRG